MGLSSRMVLFCVTAVTWWSIVFDSPRVRKTDILGIYHLLQSLVDYTEPTITISQGPGAVFAISSSTSQASVNIEFPAADLTFPLPHSYHLLILRWIDYSFYFCDLFKGWVCPLWNKPSFSQIYCRTTFQKNSRPPMASVRRILKIRFDHTRFEKKKRGNRSLIGFWMLQPTILLEWYVWWFWIIHRKLKNAFILWVAVCMFMVPKGCDSTCDLWVQISRHPCVEHWVIHTYLLSPLVLEIAGTFWTVVD